MLRCRELHALVGGALSLLAAAPVAAEPLEVELELVLAVDASGSVDRDEFDLQLKGLASAFRDGEVAAALAAAPGGIAVALVQWASPGHQIVAVDWALVGDAASAALFAGRIEAAGRQMHGETSITHALRFCAGLIAGNGIDGRRKAIDLSGDGPTNFGGPPDAARDAVVAAGVAVNGLAILNEFPELDRYFRDHVVGGPGAFLEVAADYRDFAEAIRRKLIQEIKGVPVGDRGADPGPLAGYLVPNSRSPASPSPGTM